MNDPYLTRLWWHSQSMQSSPITQTPMNIEHWFLNILPLLLHSLFVVPCSIFFIPCSLFNIQPGSAPYFPHQHQKHPNNLRRKIQRLQYLKPSAHTSVILSTLNPSLIHPNNTTYRNASPNYNDCCRALAGHWRGAVSVALNFWLHLFFQEKRWKRPKQETK